MKLFSPNIVHRCTFVRKNNWNRLIRMVMSVELNWLVTALTILLANDSTTFAQQTIKPSRSSSPFNYIPKLPTVIWQASNNDISIRSIVSKPPIDSVAIKHWPNLDNKVAISNDGDYVMYNIINRPYNSNTLIVQSSFCNWKKEIENVREGIFSGDSKKCIYLKNDSLYYLTLGKDEQYVKANVSEYRFPKKANGKWIFYQLKNQEKLLVVQNLITGTEINIRNVAEYKYDEEGGMLLLKKKVLRNGYYFDDLEALNLLDGNVSPVWNSINGAQLLSYYLDASHKQFTWLVCDTLSRFPKSKYSIWYFKLGMDKPVMAVDLSNPGIESDLTLSKLSNPAFTKDGRYLCFWLMDKDQPKPNSDKAHVDIWSYHDTLLQSMQLLKIARNEIDKYQCVATVEDIKSTTSAQVIRLLQKNEEAAISYAQDISGDFFLAKEKRGGDRFWEASFVYRLVSMKNGERKTLKTSKNVKSHFWLSPNGRYLLYFGEDSQYYSCDLLSNRTQIISRSVPYNLSLENPYSKDFNLNIPVGLAGWVEGGNKVLVYDNYDIWLLDIKGIRPPLNLTNGYGRLNGYKIRLVEERKMFNRDDTILLSVFNPVNKFNGLYTIELKKAKALQKPDIGPCSIFYSRDKNQGATDIINDFFHPIKAINANTWIVKKESATASPNYYLTHDFLEYKQLTNMQPEKEFNWLSAELLNWTQLDGTVGQGVLYKPENFDYSKKYPLIISYYEQLSGRLHQYPTPQFLRSTYIEVAWFVSQGYLVLTPDIYYTKGKIMQSVCNSIVSGAQCLKLLPYVDEKKIGISGFSWGGHETNWLITQTDLFAAAATGGGMSDPISSALQISETQGKLEEDILGRREDIMGCSIWENQEAWLEASPVLHADKINTPLLIMYNYADKDWQQGGELFMALRRLNKKVWMLQYDNGDHSVYQRDREDLTIRITQFFDFFLKGSRPASWMTKGIPARLKGVETGYETDTNW